MRKYGKKELNSSVSVYLDLTEPKRNETKLPKFTEIVLFRSSTVRAHKKKTNPIVPMGPVYHNDHYLKKEEFWESDEENLEYFNDIFAIDPKIFSLDHFSGNHNDGEEISVEIHRAVSHVEPITNIGENNLEEAEGYSEQHYHIFAINPNIFAFDNFSNIDTTSDERQEATIFEINHAVIQVKPAPPYKTFSTCQ